MLPLVVNHPNIPIIINSVYRMASNLLISWARLDYQVWQVFLIISHLTSIFLTGLTAYFV